MTLVLTDIAMYCLAAGARMQAAVVDTAFEVIGCIQAVRNGGPGR